LAKKEYNRVFKGAIMNIPQTSNNDMNKIHQEEVDILIELSKLMKDNDEENITKKIQELVEHMQKHFSFEEDMMKEKSYNMYTIHQADHNKVLSETRYILMDWRNAKDMDRLNEYFGEELPSWLDQHIKAMDIPMAEYLDTL
jgi:hemerythrin